MPDALQKATEALVKLRASTTRYDEADVARIVLDAAGVQGLVEALEKWPCRWWRSDSPCNDSCECNGTGLHPIASEALTTWRGSL